MSCFLYKGWSWRSDFVRHVRHLQSSCWISHLTGLDRSKKVGIKGQIQRQGWQWETVEKGGRLDRQVKTDLSKIFQSGTKGPKEHKRATLVVICRSIFRSRFLRCNLQVESGSGWTRKSLSIRGAREKAKAKPKAKAKAERPRARARGSLAINCGSCEWARSVTVLWKVHFLKATFVFLGVWLVERG